MGTDVMKRVVLAAVAALLYLACAGDPGNPGASGTSCTVTDNGDGTVTIACTDGTSVTVENGTNGTDCTVTDNGDGTKTIACEDGTTVTVTDGASGGSCTITDNGDGTKTITCDDGTTVTVSDGDDGQSGGNVEITSLHGTSFLQSIGEFATAGKYFATMTITGATADAAGLLTVDFEVKNTANLPETGLTKVSANIAKLTPAATGVAWASWVPYIWRVETVTGSATGDWPNPDGTKGLQGNRENNGTLVNHGDGTYTYTFKTNLTMAVMDGTPVSYERNLTHRVSIMIGGRAGPTADAQFDFVPDGSAITLTRNIVETTACRQCHGLEFHGHGGDRLGLDNCATCHVPGATDAQGGGDLDLKVMIHKIHAGRDLATLPGADGIFFDNPATGGDESADNGEYALWGFGTTRNEWDGEFPSVIQNCTKCHSGSLSDVDNWKNKPSRKACGSCHDDVNFATGVNHPAGAMANDTLCASCHPASGGVIAPIIESHDFLGGDPRNVPEFDVSITFDVPARGFYIDGEAPLATIILTDKVTGLPIDHTTVRRDAAAEGCLSTGCPPADGLFTVSSFFVHGPRGHRMPVLTTAARAVVIGGTGPFDLSTAGASLVVIADQGRNLITQDVFGTVIPGVITIPVNALLFANVAAATPAEVVAWLNANAQFKARAIAFLDAGRVSIRSRNLGPVHALQLGASIVTTAVFAGDVTVHLPTGSTTANRLASDVAAPATNDPKVTLTTGAILYQMDPVDDLEPGTYIASIEITDRGRKSGTDYRTPSVQKAAFQVDTITVEKQPSGNCDLCHQSAGGGEGFVLDFQRHYKIFDNTAVDQCGACHDTQPQLATGSGWTGARPISRRVHAVHNGSALQYPMKTVDYSGGDPVAGRNWDITFPQDVRNCDTTCHEVGTTSGTWATEPGRLPCSGCHDGDAPAVHMKLMTFDPTPADPYSGDEEESCKVCH